MKTKRLTFFSFIFGKLDQGGVTYCSANKYRRTRPCYTYSEPFVIENLLNSDSVIRLRGEHSLDEILRRLAYVVPVGWLHLRKQAQCQR